MIAKGHDYQNIGLVAVLDADSRLFSQDFRAPERLFAQLVQVAGRAGRGGKNGEQGGNIFIETQFPEAAVFQYLMRHDVDGFLSHIASEREEAELPPFSYQAMIHAEAKSLDKAILAEEKSATRLNVAITKAEAKAAKAVAKANKSSAVSQAPSETSPE